MLNVFVYLDQATLRLFNPTFTSIDALGRIKTICYGKSVVCGQLGLRQGGVEGMIN